MLKVTVEYLGHIRSIVKEKKQEELEIREDSSVADLLDMLSKKYGEQFKTAVYESGCADIKPNFIATVNGFLLNQLRGIQTKLRSDDRVTLMPVVSGG